VAAPTADDYEVGEVEDISLGYTVLRTDDGRQIVIANGTMAQQTMIRLSGQAEALPSSPQAVTKPAAR